MPRWAAVLLLLLASCDPAAGPGGFRAEGFGAGAKGGEGGRVIAVTNLNDSGPGSLRAAVEESGPRIIVFEVAGLITLESTLTVKNPCVTIDGSTAPGGGICLKKRGLMVNTDHAIVRHLRVRPGDEAGVELDAISVFQSNHVVIDHCSASWAIDETLSVTRSKNVTVQWCIISESLNSSHHHKGQHGYGSLINGDRITFHHNLYVHHLSRNPRPGDGLIDFRNNVVYNWGHRAGYNGVQPTIFNYVGNYLKRGPSSVGQHRDTAFSIGGAGTRMYAAGNVMEGFAEGSRDNWRMINHVNENRVGRPFDVAPVTTHDAKAACALVLERAGATLPARDAVDRRIIREIRTGAGKIIDSQKEVGGWPSY